MVTETPPPVDGGQRSSGRVHTSRHDNRRTPELLPEHVTRSRDQSFTAVLVAPPCCVTRGRQRTLMAPLVNASSVALLDQMKASPGRRCAIFSGVRPAERSVRLLDVLQPRGRVELVEDDLARELDERNGHRGRVLARDHDARALVPHLAHDLDEAGNEVRALDVLVSLVEDDELVELARPRTVISRRRAAGARRRDRALRPSR